MNYKRILREITKHFQAIFKKTIRQIMLKLRKVNDILLKIWDYFKKFKKFWKDVFDKIKYI